MKIYHKIWNENNPDDLIFPNDGNCIHHIDGNHSNNNPNNLQKMARGEHSKTHRKGFTLSEETKIKIRLAGLGRNHSEETKKKISEGNKNKIVSEESRIKMSIKQKQVVKSEKWKEKVSKALKGRKFSKEWRKKLSESQKGENNSSSKLNWDKVDLIRRIFYIFGDVKIKDIAIIFDVNGQTISDIKNNKTWKKMIKHTDQVSRLEKELEEVKNKEVIWPEKMLF